jgi:hypothetical protein
MVMTAARVFVTGGSWLSVVYLLSCFLLCYLYLRWLPHMHAWVNHVRVATAFCLQYTAVILIVLVYHPGVDSGNDADMEAFR